MHVIVPAYNCERFIGRCLDSLAEQVPAAHKVLVINDASTDRTGDIIREQCDAHAWTQVHNDVNLRAGYNLFHGVHSMLPAADDVIFILDGDDFLPHGHVLARIAEVYEDPDAWFVYARYEPHPRNTGQIDSRPYPVEWLEDAPSGRLRYEENLANHPLTFRYGLFCGLTSADMTDEDGCWFRAGYDRLMFIPMLEMASPNHIRFIDEPLYCYNAENPLSDTYVNLADAQAAHRAVATRPPKHPLHAMDTEA